MFALSDIYFGFSAWCTSPAKRSLIFLWSCEMTSKLSRVVSQLSVWYSSWLFPSKKVQASGPHKYVLLTKRFTAILVLCSFNIFNWTVQYDQYRNSRILAWSGRHHPTHIRIPLSIYMIFPFAARRSFPAARPPRRRTMLPFSLKVVWFVLCFSGKFLGLH
jgi:hypothetical protein